MCFGSTDVLQHTYHQSGFEESLEAWRGKKAQGEKIPVMKNIAVKPEIFLKSLFSPVNSKDKRTHVLINSDGCANI